MLKPNAYAWGIDAGYAREPALLAPLASHRIPAPAHAEAILADGRADLICVAREALHNSHWALHAALELEGEEGYRHWPPQYGWWLQRRQRYLERPEREAG